MSLEFILEGVPGDRRLSDRRPGVYPLGDLIDAYALLSAANPNVDKIDDDWTIDHLRKAVAKLTVAERTILTGMLSADPSQCASPWAYETPKEREERQLWHFVIKVAVISVIPTIMFLTGAVVILGMMSGKVSANFLTSTLLNTAMEIMKLIFGASSH